MSSYSLFANSVPSRFFCQIVSFICIFQKKVVLLRPVMQKRIIFSLFALCALACGMSAENRWGVIDRPHEIRVGWGDQFFETLMWHKPNAVITSMPTTWQKTYKEDFVYSQHIWVEYHYRFKYWVSFGGMIDCSGVQWDDVIRDGSGAEVGRLKNQHFFNLVIMPTVRFTYFHHPNVNLYSGLGIGLDINGGTETDAKGKHTAVGAAVNVTVFGVSANYKQYFATVDFGGLTALQNANVIYMAVSRMMNISLGMRF